MLASGYLSECNLSGEGQTTFWDDDSLVNLIYENANGEKNGTTNITEIYRIFSIHRILRYLSQSASRYSNLKQTHYPDFLITHRDFLRWKKSRRRMRFSDGSEPISNLSSDLLKKHSDISKLQGREEYSAL